MSHTELQGRTQKDFTTLNGSHHTWYRTFQTIPGSTEWYLRVVVEDDSQDVELTLGPLDAVGVDRLTTLLANTYCHYRANVESPFESHIAQGLSCEQE